jgi:hypothetical protein
MPRQASNLADLRNDIDAALERLSKANGDLPLPIDLAELCRIIGVEWEFRWMIPEGVTGVVEERLKIFLRSNFSEEGRSDVRQRFTWAHEICHALLYNIDSRPPKPRPDAPNGAALEGLCQRGAGYLLMPTSAVEKYFNFKNPLSTMADVTMLAETFGVSYEVVVRRLKEITRCLQASYALVLLRNEDGTDYIQAAAHDIWLETVVSAPVSGQAFAGWAKLLTDRCTQIGPDEWEGDDLSLKVRRVTRSLSIAEITRK